MADFKTVPCCASMAASQERCVSCQSSCSCADGPCHCSPSSSSVVMETLQARPCAGSDAMKAGGDICGCPQQCPCRKAGCATTGPVDVNLCSGQAGGTVCCTMPGNCGCSKGSVGKL